MPWHVTRSSTCPPSKPWACIKDADGTVEGCHASEADAQKQMAALYANEPSMDMPMEGAGMAGRTWYQMENKTGPDAATIYLYDEIGQWGTPASEFIKELRDVKTSAIDLHINSPGGECYDGLAIFNALRQHRADVTVYIDGLAASAASFVAMAGDRVVAEPNASLMIHNAHAVGVGDGGDMRKLADMLDRMSDTIAGIYAQRTGGDVGAWREAMGAETWFNAEEAKTAGLVDEIAPPPPKAARMPRNTWDLSIFNFAGRDKAPTPSIAVNHAQPDEPPDEPPAEPEPIPDPASEPGFSLPPIVAMRDALEALETIPFDFEVFAAAVAIVANDAPAAPDPVLADPVPPEPELSIDLPAFRRSIREARL